MKKSLIIIVSTLSLFISLSTFANIHFYQKLCNYTQETLHITTSKKQKTHTGGLRDTTLAPNECPTYRYSASPSDILGYASFQENVYKISPAIQIAKFYIYHAKNKHTYFKIPNPPNGCLITMSRHHRRHYTINICDSKSIQHCI